MLFVKSRAKQRLGIVGCSCASWALSPLTYSCSRRESTAGEGFKVVSLRLLRWDSSGQMLQAPEGPTCL